MNKPSTPLPASERDPKTVFIGVPIGGDFLWDLPRLLGILENLPNSEGYKFICRKVTGHGLPWGRNLLLYAARCTPASQVIFIDGDIPFTPKHLIRLLSHPVDYVGALYPKKQLTGLNWVGEFDRAEQEDLGPGGLWPMLSVGTGLVRVSMSAFDRMIEENPDRAFENEEDYFGEDGFGLRRGQVMHDLFGQGVIKDDWFGRTYPRYVTEDYFLSWLYRKAGGECWTDPGCQVGHVGKVDFLAVYSLIEKSVDDALKRYKSDLVAAGVKVPVLVKKA